MDRMDITTQAKKREANLFTYFTPTNTTTAIRMRNTVPYTLMLFSMALDASWAPEGWKIAACGTIYVWKRRRQKWAGETPAQNSVWDRAPLLEMWITLHSAAWNLQNLHWESFTGKVKREQPSLCQQYNWTNFIKDECESWIKSHFHLCCQRISQAANSVCSF